MSAELERSIVGTLFEADWVASDAAILWPNVGSEPGPEDSFVRVSIARGEDDRLEFGADNCTVRSYGRVFVQVFVPAGSGDLEARRLCDKAATIFKTNSQISAQDGRMIFRTPSIKAIGTSGAHYQMNVSVPYLFDTI